MATMVVDAAAAAAAEPSQTLIETAHVRFALGQTPQDAPLRAKLMETVVKYDMAPYYQSVCDQFKWPVDEQLLGQLRKNNEERLAALDAKILDAVENLGDNEVREANLQKFEYYHIIGDKENTLKQFDLTLEKTMALGHKVDLVFSMIRATILHLDLELMDRYIKKAHQLQEKDGDWERRNRLKVYEGLYWLCMRDFSKSATQFLDCIATFTCTDVMSYNTFIKFTVLTTMVGLGRETLREKVISAPEVIAVLHEIPHLEMFLTSLYKCVYSKFFIALGHVTDLLRLDRFWSPHASYFCREMRVIGYSQFLSSYRSVTLDSMARSFGVTVTFLDQELSRFIASRRLNCKIDKVSGIVETIRNDTKNAQYAATITQGDLLLNRIQKLSRVIHV